MVSAILRQYLDKVVDHRCWEAPVLTLTLALALTLTPP